MHTKRIHYLDLLRIIAIFEVIIIHVASQGFSHNAVSHHYWLGLNFWDSISRICVPLFVMISGALFLNPERQITVKHLFSKNIWRITTAYLFWNLFYAGYSFYIQGANRAALFKILISGYAHLWFLPMIVGLYLIVPFLRKITTNDQLCLYFLELAFIFAIFLPSIFSIYHVLTNYYHFPAIINILFRHLHRFITHFYFKFSLGFTGYFIAGYYFSKQKSQHVDLVLYFLSLLSLISIFLGTQFFSIRFDKPTLPLYSYMSLPVAIASIGVFVLVKNLSQRINWNNVFLKRHLAQLANLTFGIYLVHFIFVQPFIKLFHNFYLNYSLVSVPILSILIFIVSTAIVWLMSFIPWVNKHLI